MTRGNKARLGTKLGRALILRIQRWQSAHITASWQHPFERMDPVCALVIQRYRMHFGLAAACGGRSLWFVDQQVVTIEFTMEQYLVSGSKKMA